MAISKLQFAARTSSFWLGIFILASLIIGLNIFQDYGVSFDEPGIFSFAPVSLEMYSTAFHPPEKPVYQRESFLRRSGIPTNLFNYGPFYFMAAELFARGLHTLGIQTPSWDLWHLAYFLTFEAGVLVFYLLCRRWLSGWAALGATVLFGTQPLLVGHAFMNPKDLPFMVFFLATVYSGLIMADKIKPEAQAISQLSLRDLPALVQKEWQSIPHETVRKFRRQVLLWLGAILLVGLTHPLWNIALQRTVNALHSAPATSLPGKILQLFSRDPQSIPVQDFIGKGQTWLSRLELLIILLIAGRILWITYQLLPRSGTLIGSAFTRPLHPLIRSLINPWILLAGILLGFTLSNRLFAPLAAALVLVFLFWKHRQQAIPPAIAYTVIAWITMYLTWPYLWGNPIKHLLKSWQVMNAFSVPGSWSELPTLLATQYTVPAVLLTVAGMVIAAVEFVRGKRSGLFFLFLGWTVLPIGVLILRRSHLYDNFRQVLFLIPPFFMMAGLAIEKIVARISHPALIVLLIFVISLPGIWAGTKLHPYQYAYYNEFVSGSKSNFRAYSGDYWGTSLKEIADYLNNTAPVNAAIRACTSADIFAPYLRSDLRLMYTCEPVSAADSQTSYIVLSSPKNLDTIPYPQRNVVYSVSREDSTYAVILSVSANTK